MKCFRASLNQWINAIAKDSAGSTSSFYFFDFVKACGLKKTQFTFFNVPILWMPWVGVIGGIFSSSVYSDVNVFH